MLSVAKDEQPRGIHFDYKRAMYWELKNTNKYVNNDFEVFKLYLRRQPSRIVQMKWNVIVTIAL